MVRSRQPQPDVDISGGMATTERDLWREVLVRAVKDLREGAAPAGGAGVRGAAPSCLGGDSSSTGGNNLMRQLQQAEAGYSSHANHEGGGAPRVHRDGTITVVGYEGSGGYGSSNSPSAPTHGGYHAPPPPPPPPPPPVPSPDSGFIQKAHLFFSSNILLCTM